MSVTWRSDDQPPVIRRGAGHAPRVILRGGLLILLILAGVLVTLPLRLIEWPIYGMGRPWSPRVTQWVSGCVFRVLGMRHRIEGTPMTGPGAVVSNHVSWLDIFALNARTRVYFVAKSEVARWPGIGALAKMVGTVFIERNPRAARSQTALFAERLGVGHRLLFFPEGSSTDGFRVLPFKTTLFQAFFTPAERHDLQVQPVTIIYSAPEGQDPRFYGWWGDMGFAAHLVEVLGAPRQGEVRLIYHAPLDVSEFGDRKALASAAQDLVRSGMSQERLHHA
jgi:1-acyl-sn-glycerol-3-phosphate acyltransferase